MCLFKKWKKLKAERDFYKSKYFEETKYSSQMKLSQKDAELEASRLRDENEKLKQEKQRLEEENLAKRNIIEENNRKAKKQKAKMDQMQRRIETLDAKLNSKPEQKDDPFFGNQQS